MNVNKSYVLVENEYHKDGLHLNHIYLFKSGTFYNAYNWSCFLLHYYLNGLKDSDKLKISYQELPDLSQVIQSGFPVTTQSLQKFVPDYKIVQELQDKYLIIEVDLEEISKNNDIESIDLIHYKDIYKNFLNTKCKTKKSSLKKQKHNNLQISLTNKHVNLFLIASKILSFQVSGKTLNELLKFINDLKEQTLLLVC